MSHLAPMTSECATPAALVDEFLRIIMIPDSVAARRFTSPDMRIRFTGGRAMNEPADCTSFNATRDKWVKKRIERTETVVTSAVTPDARKPHADETVVYSTGTLYGQWPDGTPFKGNR